MKHRRNQLRRKGFTLIELLLVIAIITALGAVGVYKLVQSSKNLTQSELDSYAEIIYSAAQQRLTELKTEGRSEVYNPKEDLSGNLQKFAEGLSLNALAESGEEINRLQSNIKNMAYIKVNGIDIDEAFPADIRELMPSDRADKKLLSGNWIIEYNYETGQVYGVFFSAKEDDKSDESNPLFENYPECLEPGNSDKDESGNYLNLNYYRNDEYRQQNLIGYYCGGESDYIEADITLKPVVTVSNGLDLVAHFECPQPSHFEDNIKFTYVIYPLQSDGQRVTDASIQYKGTTDVVSYENGKYSVDIVLDSFDDTHKFSEFGFGDYNGSTFRIELTADGVKTPTKSVTSTTTFNSLFGNNSPEGTADIYNPRHLQNLDEKSELSDDIEDVNIYDNIEWPENTTFSAIDNTNIKELEGNNKDISKLPDSLFKQFKGDLIQNLDLVDSKVLNNVNSDDTGFAGALANVLTGSDSGTTIYNVGAFLKDDKPSSLDENSLDLANDPEKFPRAITSERKAAGGLIGKANGNKITMEKCYAALTVDGESAAGGLIGLVYKADVTLINCYADSYVFGPFAGGLVGYIDGVSDNKGTVEIQSCYAAGYLYGTVTTVIKQETGCRQGGLIAEKKTNAIISIEKKSYTVCEFMGVGSKITTIPGGNINLYYLNNGDESHINGTVYKGEVLEGGFDAGKQAANAYNLLSQYEKYPNEPKYYEYPGIKGLPHYGDWGPLSKGELKVSVVNGEKLVAYVTVSGIKSPVVTYKFTGLSSNKVKTITMSGITSSAIIDSLESSSTRFKSQFAGFYPGEYVKLEVSANEGKLTAAAISFNSLYYDDNGKVATSSAVGTYYSDNDRYAVITCGRHLQNLDASAQDSNKLFTRAMVKKNISFGQGSDWAKAYSSLTFSAITNNSLVAFNGGNKTITDLKVNTSGNAGLFKNIGNSSKNVTITAITMVRPNIKGTGNVGVIAGETNTSSAGITITSCAAIDAVVSTSGEYAGGLIGRNNANTTISNCSNRLNTLASNSSFKSSIDSNGASSQPNVFGKLASGGLVGITADSCDLAIKNSFAAVVVGGSDCENSGGLIGKTGVSAPNNNPSTGETVTTPVDFVLVLDQSGSMAYDYSNSSTTKQQALKNSATSFINLAAKQDCIDGSTHRVAIVGFESDAWNISNGLTDLTTSGANTLVNKVNALPKSPSGGTHMDEGLQLAIDILKNRTETTYTLEDGSKLARKTVVVFFTDGYPGDQQASGDYFTSYYDTDQFADAAVAKASVLKGMGATIFCVGAFDGANPSTAYTTTLGQETARGWFSSGTYKTWTTAAKSANGLMHFISSDYDATCTSWTGFTTSNAGTNKGYYMSANDPDALLTALNMILEKVTPQIPVVTSNHVAGISNSYADCYTTANHYASGLIGLVNGIPASVNNSYASGYTNIAGNKSYTSKVQAGLAACAASDYISISNSYTIIKPSTTTNFCSTVNENPKAYNNLYYKIVGDLSLYGYRIQSSAASDLGDAFVDASTVTPYNLRNQGLSSTAYPAPVLSGIHHYGDWHPYPNTTAKVTVTVSNSNVLTSTISLEVSGAETNEVSVNYTVSQNGNAESYQKTCVVSLDSSGKGSTTITLDDLSSSEKHFNSLFPKLTAGANCTITVTSVSDCSFASSGNTLAKNFNSLYAENTSGSNVHISCARHLQNLDVKTSKVALTGITAILDSDVVASGVVEVNPIQNENLVVFNGNNHTITDLKLASNNMVGLFASVGSLTNQTTEYIVQNLKLSGPVIDCTLQDSAAGAIAGKTYGNVLIQNCYVTDAKVVASNNGNAGGLVGINDGSLRISNCGVYYAGQKPSVSNGSSSGNRVYGGSASGGLVGYTPSNSVIWISNSFAAVVVGDISTTNYAGGLIGKSDARNSWSGSGVTVTGTQINNSYADCYVSGKYSCGFVGHMSPDTSSNLKVFDCYVSGFLYTKYKASKGGVMSGITYIDDKVNVEVRHFYNVCGYNGNWEYTAYSATNKYGGEYSNVYYISRDGNYTYPRHGDQKSLNDIKGLTSKLGSSFTTNSPYANGSYPGLNGVPHYSYN